MMDYLRGLLIVISLFIAIVKTSQCIAFLCASAKERSESVIQGCSMLARVSRERSGVAQVHKLDDRSDDQQHRVNALAHSTV